jgi:hypothetical protein
MEQMAQPGTILLTPETLALAEGFVQVTSRGPVPVKGLAAPLEIFELAGASPVRSRLNAAASRGLTRFVGRDAEIELLRQALGRAGEGHGQLVAVVGEPGVGKSRLVWEFTHSHRRQGWLVLEAASVSYAKATTYFPVIDLLRSYFGIVPGDDGRRMREKVTGKLLSLDRLLEPTLPVFLSLLDVTVEDPAWTRLDPPQRRRQTLEALKRLLLLESQVQPVLLVVEDLHWIDGETQAWLDVLVESLPTARLLLLVNYRPEYGHGWGSKTYYQQVRLDTMPAEHAGELLEELLGMGPGLEDLPGLLIARTQGNPSFSRRAYGRWWRSGRSPGSAGPIDSRGRSSTFSCRPRRRRSWPRASTAWRPATSGCCRLRRSSARTCRFRCCWRSPRSRRTGFVNRLHDCRRPSSCTKRGSSRRSSTRSSTR